MDGRWYVVRTESRAEYLAAKELNRDGIEVFFPRIKTNQPRNGHYDTPLFPGYLFLRCIPDDESWPTFGPRHRILGWLKFGGEFPWLPNEEVNDLQERAASINHQGGVWRRFRPGERVRVVSRTIQGVAEVVAGTKSPEGRVRVLLEFMGRVVAAQVPWDSIQPLESEPGEPRQLSRRTRGRGRWIQGFGSRATATT